MLDTHGTTDSQEGRQAKEAILQENKEFGSRSCKGGSTGLPSIRPLTTILLKGEVLRGCKAENYTELTSPPRCQMLPAWTLLLLGCLRTSLEKDRHTVLESIRTELCLPLYGIYDLG